MRILIFGASYEPDLGPSAPLYTMLSQGLVKRGHQVTVITSVPHYPSGKVPASYRGKWFWCTCEDGVNVIRVNLPSVDRKKLRLRFLQIICYQLGAFFVCLGQKYDVALTATPALSMCLPYFWAVVVRHKPAIYSIHDVYPDVGVTLGVFRNKLVIDAVAKLERFCLNHSKVVRILSNSFRPGLYKLGVSDSKMVLVYDWVDTNLVRPLPKINPFSQQQHLNEKYVVLYAGNIGLSQGLDQVLEAAALLSDHKDIQFVFVGDGSGRELLQSQAKQRQLTNVQFIPFQPRERLPEVLACADVSLVILRRGIGLESLPSKTYSIMASARPILVSVDEESETSKLIKRADAGFWVPPEDPGKLADAIMALKSNNELRARLGHNGRVWVEKNHSSQFATEQFEKLLLRAISLDGEKG